MKKRVLFLVFILFTLQANATDYKLIGSYLLEYSVFKIDVYQITYFKAQDAQKLVLEYKLAVKKDHSLEGWKLGLKHKLKDNLYLKKAQWIFDHTYDVEKGDRLSIIKKGGMLEIYHNEVLKGQTSDPIITELAFEPWLGEKPVDVGLKASLLGK